MLEKGGSTVNDIIAHILSEYILAVRLFKYRIYSNKRPASI